MQINWHSDKRYHRTMLKSTNVTVSLKVIHVYSVDRLSLKVYEINGCCLDTNIKYPSLSGTASLRWACKYHDSLRWHHNGRDSVSNHQPHHCLLSRLLGRRSKKTSKLLVTGLCVGNSPGTGEFPAQMASNAENVSIWWRHHVRNITLCLRFFCNIIAIWLWRDEQIHI